MSGAAAGAACRLAAHTHALRRRLTRPSFQPRTRPAAALPTTASPPHHNPRPLDSLALQALHSCCASAWHHRHCLPVAKTQSRSAKAAAAALLHAAARAVLRAGHPGR